MGLGGGETWGTDAASDGAGADAGGGCAGAVEGSAGGAGGGSCARTAEAGLKARAAPIANRETCRAFTVTSWWGAVASPGRANA